MSIMRLEPSTFRREATPDTTRLIKIRSIMNPKETKGHEGDDDGGWTKICWRKQQP